MKDKDIINKLRNDDDYYGEFGQQFLSNSNIRTLLDNPADLRTPTPDNPNFKIGGYFHTMILEPEKLDKFKIIDASTRSTSKYKKEANGNICLLKHEVDNLNAMSEVLLSNKLCKDLISPLLGDYSYEEPGITYLFDNKWKGKADILNHEKKLIVDLKTTSNIKDFKWSASKYNYDSQAYIYRELFGYDMIFLVIDKKTKQLGIFECSDNFYNTGESKVQQASEVYDMFYKNKDFDISQHITTEIL